MPSLVPGSASGVADCIQKPCGPSTVTTPGTPATGLLARGDRWLVPWISAIGGRATGGGATQSSCGVALFWGVGSTLAKSAALSSVSTQVLLRVEEVALVVAAAGPLSETAAPPQPSRSTTAPVASTTATWPPVPDRLSVPVTSGAGSAVAEAFAPAPSWTRKWPPGVMDPVSGVAPAGLLPAAAPADQYCTCQPVRSTADLPWLNSSTKSLRHVAPELPPPP